MEEWFVPAHMKEFAAKTIINFKYDQTNTTSYRFNSLGFRSPEPTTNNSIIVIGNSVSFGIGLPEEQTYGSLVASAYQYNYLNCALGCYYHENHDYLINLKKLASRLTDDIFLIQINNLDRHRVGDTVTSTGDKAQAVAKFIDYFNKIEEILHNKQKIYLYWDNVDYDLPDNIKSKFLIYNKFHLDSSIATMPDTFGTKSHLTISKIILSKLSQFSKCR